MLLPLQPAKPKRVKGTRSNILNLNMANECAEMEDTLQSSVERDEKQGESDELHLSAETYQDDLPETSFKIKDPNLMDAYKQAAPVLLNELAHLLSQHNWTEEGCIPHGIVNILNYSWQDLTAGAVHLKSPEQTEMEEKFKCSPLLEEEGCSNPVSAIERRESGGRSSPVAGVRKQEVGSKQLANKRNPKTAHNLTTFSFSFPSDSIKDPGWIIQPKQPSCDEPQRISLCQWVVERLQAARDPENLQTTEQGLNQLITLRYYGENLADKRPRKKAQPTTLANRTSQIPEAKQQNSARQRLHYKIKDGSSFIYYRSGCMAVCQSCSGLPCGGFYTNVFSDSKCPVIMATITAFGHGTVSSAISAVWDQDGGFVSDHQGNITKEWSWQEYRTPREKIVIQVSDRISVRLLSGTSAVLCFRCDRESIQLRLSALVNVHKSMKMGQPCLRTKENFTSDFAEDLLLLTTTKSPAVILGSKTNLILTPMVTEVEELEEQSGQLRRGGHVSRELKRLKERVRNIVDDWLDYYRSAIGIKCPGVERMPDAPLRTRLKREVQSAALPSLNPPERADAEPVQLKDGRNELQKPHRHLSAPAERPLDTVVKLPRSVIILSCPDPQPSDVPSCPAPPPFTPSTPLTVCPALLRAALLGEEGRKRCCCSATLMPALTDLEYDAFIMGQPQHSQQILVVCVTPLPQPVNTHPPQNQVVLEQLYKKRNRHRTTPCTQCQMDSFRLLRYEMSTRKTSCGEESLLLQQRHNAAPGMVLMYIRGKLLFVGYIFSDHSCSVRDLENQISRSRGDYRLGLSLPLDYKFRDAANASAEEDEHKSQDEIPKEGKDLILTASVEIANINKRKYNQVPRVSHQKQKDARIKPKKAPALPPIPVITN
ncbi:uncharacterized protein C3orf20-like [Cheilinus undulatus]|uniref:uncharacterized protein C3orf20-like n=1 Tax=Cheilinus undulatus TaxID=241271 RepID=UPI001BD4C0D8|nr:uncharacterized protein C3orf20-like [Cheilinus undulatus]